MNTRYICLVFSLVLLLLLVACGPSPEQIATTTASAWTSTPKPTSTPEPTSTPKPTSTPEPSRTPVPPTETAIPPTSTPTKIPPTKTPTLEPTVDLEAAIQSSKIILFEDMWYARYIKPALDQGGFPYTDVGDKMGSFKEKLLSGTKWDLIIAAAEGRGRIEGEFFDYIKEQLDAGASVIMEIWTLDWVTGGRIQPILDECGIKFQSNWVNPSNRGVFWVDPNHPIANDPNPLSLDHFINFWTGDVGDLVSKTPGSTAMIIGSADEPNADRNGLITVCYDGRLLLQTFSTHDHSQKTMIQLWQNYVKFMLSNRFK